jgi:hypothetical protein
MGGLVKRISVHSDDRYSVLSFPPAAPGAPNPDMEPERELSQRVGDAR